MRGTSVMGLYWARYRMPLALPKFDGPAPASAPQGTNSAAGSPFVDPVEDSFPVSIRGTGAPPAGQTASLAGDERTNPRDAGHMDMWFVNHRSHADVLRDVKPWSAFAPRGAFRFRSSPAFDAIGRRAVEGRRKDTRGMWGGSREAELTRMAQTATPRIEGSRVLDAALKEWVERSPLVEQRDVGRIEKVPAYAGTIAPNAREFPYRWNTEDWYEYEVAKVRLRRFFIENDRGTSEAASEVTYRILIEAQWDHHAARLAVDILDFLREVGRAAVEEKLVAIRDHMRMAQQGVVGTEILTAFEAGSEDEYSSEEVAQHVLRELHDLEEQCLHIMAKSSVSIDPIVEKGLYDSASSWPHIEYLEPWVRMTEFWAGASDGPYSTLEKSTDKYEFRTFFRVVVVKMPFHSMEFEKRIHDIRHWLHRDCNVEFHTVAMRNIVHDEAEFPVEHDVENAATEAHHRLFSFALDWHSAPSHRRFMERWREGDTWGTVAERVGCPEADLRAANGGAAEVGGLVIVPPSATKVSTTYGQPPRTIDIGTHRSWSVIAGEIGCEVAELQLLNPAIAAASTSDTIPMPYQELFVPIDSLDADVTQDFAAEEPVQSGDTLESIAHRIGCDPKDLVKVNPSLEHQTLESSGSVKVPSSAKRPRRRFDPLMRRNDPNMTVAPSSTSEMEARGLQKGIPDDPPTASEYTYEFPTSRSRYPLTPKMQPSTADWLSYTATYLDKGLQPTASYIYNSNPLWPQQHPPDSIHHTPFEEDQTWMMNHIPVQQREVEHPEGYLQDLPNVNHEQFPRSIEWQAP